MDWKNFEVKFPEAPDVGETVRYRRYQAIEKQYPHAFIIDRMGDFYEILGDRAVEAANAIGLTLTSRSMGTEGRVPMVGFPYHVAPQYIDKLVLKPEEHTSLTEESIVGSKVLVGVKVKTKNGEEFKPLFRGDLVDTGDRLTTKEHKAVKKGVRNKGTVKKWRKHFKE